MNGWQRLWVLVSVILAICAVLVALNQLPSEDRITSLHNASIEGRERDLKAIANGDDKKTNNFYKDVVGTAEDVKGYIVKENKEYAQRISELPGERRNIIIITATLWLVACIGIYAIGWLVGWVFRGFRLKQV